MENSPTETKPVNAGVGTGDLLGDPWKNVTSYSQGGRDRTPRSWQAKFGRLRVSVTRHIDYGPKVWVLLCHDLGLERQLQSADVARAADEAIETVRALLNQMLCDLPPNVPDQPRE